MTSQKIKADIPAAFKELFKPHRIKCFYGGRGGAKSWNFARALIIRAISKKTRILCVRQIQNSISESVHKIISEQIDLMGLTASFNVTEKSISCANGSEFIFKGIHRNVTEIKSTEGVDICWVEEAQDVPKKSWKIIIPTIRKENSEIWISFNPDYLDDDTYVMWVTDPPSYCYSRHVNYDENPYFPDVLRIEMESDKARNLADYEHTWLGKPNGGGGRVWTDFDKDTHVKTFPVEQMAKTGNFYMAQDPHAHFYPACVWLCVMPMNDRQNWPEDFHFHFYNEWPQKDDMKGLYHEQRKKLTFDGTLEDLSKEIYAHDGGEYGFEVKTRGIDTRFAKGSGGWNWSTGSTQGIVELFAKKENGGLLFQMPPVKTIDSRRQVMKKDMQYNRLMPISPFNQPRLTVDPKCINLITSFTNHRLEEGEEKESEKYKDFSDAARICYSVINSWKDPIKKKPTYHHYSSGGAFG